MARGVRITAEVAELVCRLRFEGYTIPEVEVLTGLGHSAIERVISKAGGLPPRQRRVRPGCLTLAEREEISRRLALGESNPKIAEALGRAASTIWREVSANGGRDNYRAWAGENRAHVQARRPKPTKLASNLALQRQVEEWLEELWSPEQIAALLKETYADDPEMWVSHETIYHSLFVQGRGELRRELTTCLRTGRAVRRPNKRPAVRGSGSGSIPNKIMISERPAEVEDRAVPGHWEGDLILGAGNLSGVGTLVERTTRYVQLVALPHGRSAEAVRDALAAIVQLLPEHLWRSLTWDQGSEMARHEGFTIATNIAVYFCEPHSPWQRGSNENTNGLLRQYLPKGTDLSVHTQADLDSVAAHLNNRPRKTLGWKTPTQRLEALIAPTA